MLKYIYWYMWLFMWHCCRMSHQLWVTTKLCSLV